MKHNDIFKDCTQTHTHFFNLNNSSFFYVHSLVHCSVNTYNLNIYIIVCS